MKSKMNQIEIDIGYKRAYTFKLKSLDLSCQVARMQP